LKTQKKKLFIVKDRKTRIIMKDGFKIFEIAQKVRQKEDHKKVGLLTSAPICSKTKSFLKKSNISVESL